MEFNATFIVATISFIIFMMIMNKILYQPISKIVDDRDNLINDNYNHAKNNNEKAQGIYKDRDTRLNNSIAESKKLVADKIADANNKAKSATSEAKKNSIKKINNAKEDIKNKSENINSELNNRVDDIAEHISAKLLGETK